MTTYSDRFGTGQVPVDSYYTGRGWWVPFDYVTDTINIGSGFYIPFPVTDDGVAPAVSVAYVGPVPILS